jgi:hypothetical protein
MIATLPLKDELLRLRLAISIIRSLALNNAQAIFMPRYGQEKTMSRPRETKPAHTG